MIVGKTTKQKYNEAYRDITSFLNGERVFKVYCKLEDGQTVLFGWVYQYGTGYIDSFGYLSVSMCLDKPSRRVTRYYLDKSDEHIKLVDARKFGGEIETPQIKLANDMY